MANKAAFIVDGHQEQKIVQRLCPGSPVRRHNCNGRDVEVAAAAKRIASLIRLIGNSYYPFVIVFDRESRTTAAMNLAKDIESQLRSEGITDELIIGVPDRMIENWILADWANAKAKGAFVESRPPASIEGTNGKGVVMKSLPRGGRYHETIEGVDWFIACNPSTLCSKSLSFRHFAHQLRALGCSWLKEAGTRKERGTTAGKRTQE
ncbi:MAG: hypothetical protein ABFC63_06590 [Thermoguttaceae bacterium]